MIIDIFLSLIVILATLLFSWLPDANTLPWGLDSILINGTQLFTSFREIFWPLDYVLQVSLIYFGFLIAMMFVRIFIGNRSPVE